MSRIQISTDDFLSYRQLERLEDFLNGMAVGNVVISRLAAENPAPTIPAPAVVRSITNEPPGTPEIGVFYWKNVSTTVENIRNCHSYDKLESEIGENISAEACIAVLETLDKLLNKEQLSEMPKFDKICNYVLLKLLRAGQDIVPIMEPLECLKKHRTDPVHQRAIPSTEQLMKFHKASIY